MKLYLIVWLIVTILNTLIVVNESKKSRMLLLIAVIVLQHVILLLFMLDYERMGRLQWKKKEKKIKRTTRLAPK